jgi:hypothetical protein
LYKNAQQLHFLRRLVSTSHQDHKVPMVLASGSVDCPPLGANRFYPAEIERCDAPSDVRRDDQSSGDRLTLVNLRERLNAITQIDKAPDGEQSVEERGYCFIPKQTQRSIQQMWQRIVIKRGRSTPNNPDARRVDVCFASARGRDFCEPAVYISSYARAATAYIRSHARRI